MSVPNQNAAEGGFKRCSGETDCGSTVPSHGANRPARTMRASTMPPATAVGCRRNTWRSRRSARKAACIGPSAVRAGAEGKAADCGRACTSASSVPDARVEQHVRQVDHEVDQDVDAGEKENHALNDRVVAP